MPVFRWSALKSWSLGFRTFWGVAYFAAGRWPWVGSDLVGSAPFVACLLRRFVGVVVVTVAAITVVRGFLFYGVKDYAFHFYAILLETPLGQFQFFGGVCTKPCHQHGGSSMFAYDGRVCHGQDGRGVYNH